MFGFSQVCFCICVNAASRMPSRSGHCTEIKKKSPTNSLSLRPPAHINLLQLWCPTLLKKITHTTPTHAHTPRHVSKLNKPLKLTILPLGVVCREVLKPNIFQVFFFDWSCQSAASFAVRCTPSSTLRTTDSGDTYPGNVPFYNSSLECRSVERKKTI